MLRLGLDRRQCCNRLLGPALPEAIGVVGRGLGLRHEASRHTVLLAPPSFGDRPRDIPDVGIQSWFLQELTTAVAILRRAPGCCSLLSERRLACSWCLSRMPRWCSPSAEIVAVSLRPRAAST